MKKKKKKEVPFKEYEEQDNVILLSPNEDDWSCLANNHGPYTVNSIYNIMSNSFSTLSSLGHA